MWNNSLVKTKNREHWLDIAKFFGILLVVLNHMNIRIPLVTFFGGMFYMPVFFVAAGYTYRNKGESFKAFLARGINSSSLSANPPPVPPNVNAGLKITG